MSEYGEDMKNFDMYEVEKIIEIFSTGLISITFNSTTLDSHVSSIRQILPCSGVAIVCGRRMSNNMSLFIARQLVRASLTALR